jgi:preprotein translocase subunit SecD
MRMDLKWRWIIIGVVLVLSVFFLAPSLTESLPGLWKDNVRKIHLGLDLRGGTQLLLEVQVEEAIENSVNQMARDLMDLLVREKIRFRDIIPKGRTLEVILLNPDQLGEFEDLMSREYPFMNMVNSSSEGRWLRVVMEISPKEVEEIKKTAVEQALETIRNRLDPQGVRELDIIPQGTNRILVQIPFTGGEDIQHEREIERAKKLIKKVALLQFRLVDTEHSLQEALAGKVPPDSEILYTHAKDPRTGKPIRGRPILVKKQTLLTGDRLDKARVEFDQFGKPRIAISFDSKGAKIFDQIAEANVGKQLAIVLDNTVYSHPVIQRRHYGGNAVIEGNFTLEEAKDLVVVLKAGSLPAPVTIEEERTVGPSLGRDSIRAGMISMMVGMGAVVLFMALYYGAAGLIADMVLLLNVILILSAMASLRATLTLPGIAGIILTIGMAVDANVLIFERIREELRSGKAFRSALEAGYSRAFLTIIDANVTTFIAGAVLYQFGTGPIRGFAVTLCIGIVASLFTAVFVSRAVFDYLLLERRLARVSI